MCQAPNAFICVSSSVFTVGPFWGKNRYLDKNQCSDKKTLLTRIVHTVKKRASEASMGKRAKRTPLGSTDAFGDTHTDALGDTHMNAFGVWEGQRLTCKRIWGLTHM